MGRLLNKDEFTDSTGALQKYYLKMDQDNGPFNTEIEIVDNTTGEKEKVNVNVSIAYDTMRQRINIMWEDAGYTRDEYRQKDLFGYYDCAWVPMSFENDILAIKSKDSNKTIYVYLKD